MIAKLKVAIVAALVLALAGGWAWGVYTRNQRIAKLEADLGAAAVEILEAKGYIETLERRPEQVPEDPPGAETVFSGGGRVEPNPEIRYRTKFVKQDCEVPPVPTVTHPSPPSPDCDCPPQWLLDPENLGLDWAIDVKRPTASETAWVAFSGDIVAWTPDGLVERPFDAQEALEWAYAPPATCPTPRRLGWTVGVGGGWVPGEGVEPFVGAMYGWRFGRK